MLIPYTIQLDVNQDEPQVLLFVKANGFALFWEQV